MTLNGAITELVLLSEHPMMPVIFRPAIQKVIETISELEAQTEQRWISVTERLPEDDTVVLVCGKNGGVYTAIHNNSKTWKRGWWKMNSKNHYCNPTAWMPLPEPWEGEAK